LRTGVINRTNTKTISHADYLPIGRLAKIIDAANQRRTNRTNRPQM